jgi:hypothetical protein
MACLMSSARAPPGNVGRLIGTGSPPKLKSTAKSMLLRTSGSDHLVAYRASRRRGLELTLIAPATEVTLPSRSRTLFSDAFGV